MASSVSNIPPRTALDTSGDAPIYAARAFVSYAGGTNTILASKNVSSVTDNGTGNFTVNFNTHMESADYAVVLGASGAGGAPDGVASLGMGLQTSGLVQVYGIYIGNNAYGFWDCDRINVAVFA